MQITTSNKVIALKAFDVLAVDYLNGNSAPRIERATKFTQDGGILRITLDFAAYPLDWRGILMNPGSAV